jgi:hypothetical protein
MIFFVGRLLQVVWRCGAPRRGGQVDDLSDGGAVGGRGGCGVKGGRQAVAAAIASATLEAGGTAAQAARRSTPPVVECAWFRGG